MDSRERPMNDRPTGHFGRALFFSVGVGVAFGGGLVAGGVGDTRVEAPPREPEDPVARAEARTRAYEEVVKRQPLRWHQELTGPDAAMPVPPALAKVPPSPPTTPTTAAAAKSPTAHTAAVAEAVQPTDPPVDDHTLRAPEAESESAPTPVRRDDNDDSEARSARVDRVDENGGDVVGRPDARALDAAIARVVGDGAAPTPSRRYALQVASVPSAETARAEVEKWKKRGVTASIVAADVAGKGTMYRVRVTGFSSKDAAAAKKAELNEGILVAE